MARIRTIKPEFWTSAQVLECSPTARLLFIGLWNFADDCGRHVDNSKQIKAEIFPADDLLSEDVRRMLDELEQNRLIRRYVVDGQELFEITGWRHQRIDKPQPPKFPGPNGDHSANGLGTFSPEGRDSKGEDRSRGDTKGGRIDDKSSTSSPDISPEPQDPPQDGKPNGRAGHDSRTFDTIKELVKDLVEKFDTQDVTKLRKLGGRSLKLTQKQISVAIQQLREDREI